MEVLMKTKSKELNKIWNNLEDIFLNYSGLTSRVEKNLSKIGVTVVRGGKHAKLFFSNLDAACFTISLSPSDNYAGRMILRDIRRNFEANY